jgi:hypothetical protein
VAEQPPDLVVADLADIPVRQPKEAVPTAVLAPEPPETIVAGPMAA